MFDSMPTVTVSIINKCKKYPFSTGKLYEVFNTLLLQDHTPFLRKLHRKCNETRSLVVKREHAFELI